MTPQDYLVSLKVQNSVEQLLKTNASVLNIQLKSGYLSEGTFTKTTSFMKMTSSQKR